MQPVDMSPGEGVFVTALEQALAACDIDIAVHSAKDIPLEGQPEPSSPLPRARRRARRTDHPWRPQPEFIDALATVAQGALAAKSRGR